MTFVNANYLWATRTTDYTCTLLQNDTILIVGGDYSPGSWEIRNNTGGHVSHGTMWTGRQGHDAELQPSTGNVLITGGKLGYGTWELRAEDGSLVSSGNLSGTHGDGHTLTRY